MNEYGIRVRPRLHAIKPRPMTNTYVITASVYVDDVASEKEAAESVEELNRGGEPGNITIRLPDEDSGYAWSFVGLTGDPL